MKHYTLSCSCRGLAVVALSCALRATSFVVPLAGRAVSPSAHSWMSVSRPGHITGFASQWHRRIRQTRIRMSSEITGDEEPAKAGGALPHPDVSPERKEKILAVLSAVIDPGKKVVLSTTYVCAMVNTALLGPMYNAFDCSTSRHSIS